MISKIRRTTLRLAYPALASYYRSGGKCPATVMQALGIAELSWRTDFYTLHRIVKEFVPKGGTIAECGVYRGATLLGMAHVLRKEGAAKHQLFGFDSFEGFPAPAPEDALPDGRYHERALQGVYADTTLEALTQKVQALGFAQQITLVKGYFEATLGKWANYSFDLVHLDCDLYQSYVTCLDFFYPRLRRGGYMVFDEYDFSVEVYPGAKKAIDTFFADKPEKIRSFTEATVPRHFVVKQ